MPRLPDMTDHVQLIGYTADGVAVSVCGIDLYVYLWDRDPANVAGVRLHAGPDISNELATELLSALGAPFEPGRTCKSWSAVWQLERALERILPTIL